MLYTDNLPTQKQIQDTNDHVEHNSAVSQGVAVC